MKIQNNIYFSVKLIALNTLLVSSPAFAANGTWQAVSWNSFPANWNTTANWVGGIVASGAGSTANFTNNFPNYIPVNYANTTIGILNIGDAGGTDAITITSYNSGGTDQLVFDNNGSNAQINVISTGAGVSLGGNDLKANSSIDINNASAQYLAVNEMMANTAGVKTITNMGSGSGEVSLSYLRDGSGQIAVTQNSNTSNLALYSSTSHTGVTTINSGTLRARDFSVGGLNSSLGASSAAASNLVFGGGILRHDATNVASTDRLFTIGNASGNTATLDSSAVSATHSLSFTGTGATAFGNTNAHTLTLTGSNTGQNTFTSIIGNNTGATSLVKSGSGKWILSGTNTYTGATTVTAGSLVINGAVASTSVVVDGKLSGSGVMANATLSGSGSINPGNSPGIMTAAATNPSGGLDYNFEFTVGNAQPTWNAPTASGNDVLRLTTPTPFTASLSAANAVSIYLNAGALTPGEVFTGGFYTDSNSAFLSSISSGTFTYLVSSVGGAILYNGTNYDVYSGPLSFSLATVSQSADFGAGVVNGYTTQFTVIPEPGTCTLLGVGMTALLFRRRSRTQSEKI